MMRRPGIFIFSIILFFLSAIFLLVAGYGLFGNMSKMMKETASLNESIEIYRMQHKKKPASLLGNVYNRNTISLNGEWKALIDPSKKNIMNEFGHFIERNAQPESPSDLLEFSFDNGLTLNVPGDWNTQDDRLMFYEGKVWYKNEFEVKKSSNQNYFLYFGAINYEAEVYLNGELVGKHKGGFTPFNFDVSDNIKKGNNLLVILVKNIITDDDLPTSSTDWLNYGGITRDVKLVSVPKTYIENYKIQLSKNNKNEISGFVKIAGKNKKGIVKIEIPELNLEEKFIVKDGTAIINIPSTPELWSPENPKLYSVKISLENDVIEDKIGFRLISAKEGRLLLNDEPIFLKGISIHEEAIGKKGRASNRQDAIKLLSLVKEMNGNYARLAHYTHNEYMVRVADSLGILIWSEIPVYWNVKFEDEALLNMAKIRMAEMIDRDQNRACVIFWSLGNETPNNEIRNNFFLKLNSYVKEKDSTRLTTAALVFGKEEIQTMAKEYYIPTMMGKKITTWDIELNDPLADIVDVAAVNEYFGWYYSGFASKMLPFSAKKAREVMIENLHKVRFHVPNNKPLIISETGAGAKKGMTAAPEDLVVFSEEYQALVYEKQIELAKNQTNLVGISPWVLKDFQSPIRMYQGLQDYWNLKGLISDDGEKKKAFLTLQEFYETR